MHSFRQKNFKYNTNNCRFASALIMEANNKTKKPITLEYALDIEQRAYDTFVMPKNGLTIKGGLDKVGKLTNSTTRLVGFGSSVFDLYLNKGYLINVVITVTDTFMNQWNSKLPIKGGKGKILGSHVVCICKKDGRYYFVNSWYGDNRDIKEIESLNIYNVFKKYEKCGILF